MSEPRPYKPLPESVRRVVAKAEAGFFSDGKPVGVRRLTDILKRRDFLDEVVADREAVSPGFRARVDKQ